MAISAFARFFSIAGFHCISIQNYYITLVPLKSAITTSTFGLLIIQMITLQTYTDSHHRIS